MLSAVLGAGCCRRLIAMVVSAVALAIAGRGDPRRRPERSSSPTSSRRRRRDLVITRSGRGATASYVLGFRSAVSNVGDGPLIIEGHRPGREIGHDGRRPGHRARRRAAAEVIPDVGRAALRRLARPPPLAPARLRSLRAAPRRAARRGGPRPEDGLLPGRPLRRQWTRPRGGGADAASTRAAAASASRSCSASRRGSRSATATTTPPTSRASTCALTGLPAGRYVLVHRVNADRRLRELDYANNAASLLLELRWRRRPAAGPHPAAVPEHRPLRPPARRHRHA